jgi:hypothetical protein
MSDSSDDYDASSGGGSDYMDDGENAPAPPARGGGKGKAAPKKPTAAAAAAAAKAKKGKAGGTLSATTSHNTAGGGACGEDDEEDDDGEDGPMQGIAEEEEADEHEAAAAAAAAKPPRGGNNNKGRKVEDVYKKLSQLEHILLRPDTYIGSTEKQTAALWVYDGGPLGAAAAAAGTSSAAPAAAASAHPRLSFRQVTYAPGLYKIFDEILVNAADHKVRDASMDTLRVDIDAASGLVSVWNNGGGIPVEVHKGEGVYVPELIFGHLLTSSNYDDDEKKVTGGRNGYGAKLANIFSREFVVETADGARSGKRYRQVFERNMSRRSEPEVGPCPRGENWTRIAFRPDLPKFDMREGEPLEADTVALMRKRVFDIAGVLGKGVKVFLDGARVPVRSFAEYVDLYLGPAGAGEGSVPRVIERVNGRWEVAVAATDGQFQQVSFVNSVCTIKGGTHVNAVVDQVCKLSIDSCGGWGLVCFVLSRGRLYFFLFSLRRRALSLVVFFLFSTRCRRAHTRPSRPLPPPKKNPKQPTPLRFLVDKLNKKHKAANVKPFMVKNHLWVFINAAVENPAFDSQTKETLTTRPGAFGSRPDLPPAYLERVAKCGLLDNVLSFADFKNQKALTKSDGAKKSRLVGAFFLFVFFCDKRGAGRARRQNRPAAANNDDSGETRAGARTPPAPCQRRTASPRARLLIDPTTTTPPIKQASPS